MKLNNKPIYLLRAFWAAFAGIYVAVLICIIPTAVREKAYGAIAVVAVVALAVVAFACYSFQILLPVELDEQGVWVREVFGKRLYPWSSIQQAGILYIRRQYLFYNQPVLLKPGGSPRKYKDKTFRWRNIGKLIPLPYSQEVKQYIISHYGPLDFNLENGQEEKSIVIPTLEFSDEW